MSQFQPTDRTTVRKAPQRACYDRDTVYSILDEGLVAHVGFEDGGQVFALPMSYGRMGDQLVLHSSPDSRVVRFVRRGGSVCVTVTLLDGLVLARSATHHSVNYRSVVVLGAPIEVTDESRKLEALRALVEHVIPGRWSEVRPPSSAELKATAVLALPLTEVSAKMRTGPPVEPAADTKLGHWAGELPLKLTAQSPVPADSVSPESPLPPCLRDYRRSRP
jgi:nitroimidazol reductase NimA-like FMN-containing flavoprotein (pyridoxamine 5'-phosphate oxidase superfamily)